MIAVARDEESGTDPAAAVEEIPYTAHMAIINSVLGPRNHLPTPTPTNGGAESAESAAAVTIDISRDGCLRLAVTPCEPTRATPHAILTVLRESERWRGSPVTVDAQCPWTVPGEDGELQPATVNFQATVNPETNELTWIHKGRPVPGAARSELVVTMQLTRGTHSLEATVSQTTYYLGTLHHACGGTVGVQLSLFETSSAMRTPARGSVLRALPCAQPPRLLQLFDRQRWAGSLDGTTVDIWGYRQVAAAPVTRHPPAVPPSTRIVSSVSPTGGTGGRADAGVDLNGSDGSVSRTSYHVAVATVGSPAVAGHIGTFRLLRCPGGLPAPDGFALTVAELANLFATIADVVGPEEIEPETAVPFPVPILRAVGGGTDPTAATAALLNRRVCLVFPEASRVVELTACVNVGVSSAVDGSPTLAPTRESIGFGEGDAAALHRCMQKVLAAEATTVRLVESMYLITKHSCSEGGRVQQAMLGLMGNPSTPAAATASLTGILSTVNRGVTHENVVVPPRRNEPPA